MASYDVATVEDRRPDQRKRYVKARVDVHGEEVVVKDRRRVTLTTGPLSDDALVIVSTGGCGCGGLRIEDLP